MLTRPTEVVVIPGWGTEAGCPNVVAALEAEELQVHHIIPSWKGGLLAALTRVNQAISERQVSPQAALLGHSLGAVLAMGAAAERAYSRLVACSPTPTGKHLVGGNYSHVA